jgi:hypothetical protein
MQMADAAIIIPVHNHGAVVLDTLVSVAEQTRPPKRLIVVDDGSTDQTAQGIQQWLAWTDPRIDARLLRQPARGASSARNCGIGQRGDCRFVAFLDPGDLWPPDFLQRATYYLETDSRAVAVSCDRLTVNAAKNTRRREVLAGIAENPPRWLFTRDPRVGSCTLFRAEAILSLGHDASLAVADGAGLMLRLSVSGPWLYAAGKPALFRVKTAQRGAPGGPGHGPPDCLAWAEVCEDFIHSHSVRQFMTPREVRFHLARRWYRAGRQLAASDRFDAALRCYRRSCYWRSWSRARCHLAAGCITAGGVRRCLRAIRLAARPAPVARQRRAEGIPSSPLGQVEDQDRVASPADRAEAAKLPERVVRQHVQAL